MGLSPELGGTTSLRIQQSLVAQKSDTVCEFVGKVRRTCDFPISSGRSGLPLKPWEFETDFEATPDG